MTRSASPPRPVARPAPIIQARVSCPRVVWELRSALRGQLVRAASAHYGTTGSPTPPRTADTSSVDSTPTGFFVLGSTTTRWVISCSAII